MRNDRTLDLTTMVRRKRSRWSVENVYVRDYDTPRAVRSGLGRYVTKYNEERPHTALKYHTPAAVYFRQERPAAAA